MTFIDQLHSFLGDVAAQFGLPEMPLIVTKLVWWLVASVLLFTVALTIGGLFTWVFRRLFAFFGLRKGPNRVGPEGMLQFLADGIKLLTKEDLLPSKADKWTYRLAPYVVVVPFVLAWAPLPWSDVIIFSNLAYGVVFILAVSALPPLGELMAAWGSNNKYSMYGGIRAAALDFSYEIPLVISAASIVLLVGGLDTQGAVMAQQGYWFGFIPKWFVFPQIIGAFIFFVSLLAKTGIIPTDLGESESELISGLTTEYSGMRFGFFFVAMFSGIFFLSALTVTFFFGGWTGPGFLPPLVWFLLKTFGLVFLVFWIWVTLPRFRVDQFLNYAWKTLFPLSILNLVIAVALKVWGVY
ncbi:MAG: NADH-quinone oxidoreductase subunit H [Euryarchaeota archaeon]|nr:NADH-quinone oxidoreductase subunit H [Euryarchaeota archaeon]